MVGTPNVDAALSRVGQHLLRYLHDETDALWSMGPAPLDTSTGTSFGIPASDGAPIAFLSMAGVPDPDRYSRLGEAVATALGQIAEAKARSVIVMHDLSEPISITGNGTDGRLVAYFQPIVALRTGEVVAIEALARMQTAEGVLGPESFLAEYNTEAAMLTLFDRMLESALQFLSDSRHRLPNLSAAINLEFAGVPDHGLVSLVRQRLDEFQTSADSLTIELNERLGTTLSADAVNELRTLAEMGVSLLLDEAPHGVHSFDRLQGVAVSGVKLDRRYVKQINAGEREIEEVRTILANAERAGIDVIAEGVETQAQCDKLVQLGCSFGQGYLFAVPQPASSLAVVLDAPLVGSLVNTRGIETLSR